MIAVVFDFSIVVAAAAWKSHAVVAVKEKAAQQCFCGLCVESFLMRESEFLRGLTIRGQAQKKNILHGSTARYRTKTHAIL
jgi:hypothetical protein